MTMVASRVDGPAATSATPIELSLWLAGATGVAAATELALLRLGTRTAIHIPAIEHVAGPYQAVAGAGRFAYFAAVVLLTMTLVLLASQFARMTRPIETTAVTTFLLAAVASRSGIVADDLLGIVVVAAVVALGVAAAARLEGAGRLVPPVFALAVVLAAIHTLAYTDAAWLLDMSEVLAVVAALLTPLLLRDHLDRRAWIWGIVTAAIVFAALGPGGATTRILLLWNFGLAGSLPAPLYALAIGALVMAIGAAVRAGRTELVVALALLFIGGVALHSTYQSGLVVAGLAVLALSDHSAERTTRSRSSRCDSRV